MSVKYDQIDFHVKRDALRSLYQLFLQEQLDEDLEKELFQALAENPELAAEFESLSVTSQQSSNDDSTYNDWCYFSDETLFLLSKVIDGEASKSEREQVVSHYLAVSDVEQRQYDQYFQIAKELITARTKALFEISLEDTILTTLLNTQTQEVARQKHHLTFWQQLVRPKFIFASSFFACVLLLFTFLQKSTLEEHETESLLADNKAMVEEIESASHNTFIYTSDEHAVTIIWLSQEQRQKEEQIHG